MFTATLFDYNGVLVDDEAVHLAAFQDVLRPLGIELRAEDYWESYLGFDDREAFAAVLGDQGQRVDDALVAELIEKKKPVYLERARHALKGFAGAGELVRRRAASGPVVIVSGALRDEILLGLDVLGVRDAVLGIVSAEDTRRSKPDPEGYLLGLDLLAAHGVGDPRRAGVVFEDSLEGVKAAKAAGLVCVGVAHSYPVALLSQAGADASVGALSEVTDALLSALAAR